MAEDAFIVVKSSDVKAGLAKGWRQAQESGAPVVITTNGVPELVIYAFQEPVILATETRVMQIMRSAYYAISERKGPPEEFLDSMPALGPDMLRREPADVKQRTRTMMTPFWYMYYGQKVGVAFPIPYRDAWPFVGRLDKLLRPEEYA